MKKRVHISIFILISLLLQSCIKEDLRYCKPILLLRYKYILNDKYTDRFKTDINKITIYVFDSNNKYVDVFSEYTTNLSNNNTMSIPLPEGEYRVVAYGGDLTSYTVDINDLSDLRLTLNNTTDNNGDLIPINPPNDLYAGFAQEAVSSLSGNIITDIELIKDTKIINIELYNQNTTYTPLDIQIKSKNGKYAFDNSIDNSYGIFKYTPTSIREENNNIYTKLKLMRLVIGNPTELTITNPTTSKIIYQKDIIDQILQHPKYSFQSDLDREDEFLIKIYIKNIDNNINISVSINGWMINNVTPNTE